jgi:hypothetical protein
LGLGNRDSWNGIWELSGRLLERFNEYELEQAWTRLSGRFDEYKSRQTANDGNGSVVKWGYDVLEWAEPLKRFDEYKLEWLARLPGRFNEYKPR